MIITIVVFSFVFISLIMIGRTLERKEWNNGVCKECGTEWRLFTIDSQGGRGYHCSCEDRHICWISYSVDK